MVQPAEREVNWSREPSADDNYPLKRDCAPIGLPKQDLFKEIGSKLSLFGPTIRHLRIKFVTSARVEISDPPGADLPPCPLLGLGPWLFRH
jgi:hypothetical protein